MREYFDAVMAWLAPKLTYGGAGGSTLSFFLSSEFGVICGVLIAAAGWVVNLYYKRKGHALQREQDERMREQHDAWMREHHARMRELDE
jgi:hypothetical protein